MESAGGHAAELQNLEAGRLHVIVSQAGRRIILNKQRGLT
jgi:hypothetical protein